MCATSLLCVRPLCSFLLMLAFYCLVAAALLLFAYCMSTLFRCVVCDASVVQSSAFSPAPIHHI